MRGMDVELVVLLQVVVQLVLISHSMRVSKLRATHAGSFAVLNLVRKSRFSHVAAVHCHASFNAQSSKLKSPWKLLGTCLGWPSLHHAHDAQRRAGELYEAVKMDLTQPPSNSTSIS